MEGDTPPPETFFQGGMVDGFTVHYDAIHIENECKARIHT